MHFHNSNILSNLNLEVLANLNDEVGEPASAQEEKDPKLPPRGSLKLLKLGSLPFLPSVLEEEVEDKDPCHPQRQPKFVKISDIYNFIISIQQYSLVFEVLKAASWFSSTFAPLT